MRQLAVVLVAPFLFALVACESPSPADGESQPDQPSKESSENTQKADDDDESSDDMDNESSDGTKKAAESEPSAGEENESKEPSDFTGEVEREAILEGDRRWAERYEQAEVDEDVAEALGEVDPGARVEVYLGVWCEDSMREVPRFWRAFDAAGMVPFEIEHIGLNREFSAGDVSLEGLDIEAVPTFIVYRDGEEVGRIVEDSPENIETHLLALLTGEASGVISASR